MTPISRGTLGSAFRAARLDRGLTQAQVGKAAEISRSMVAAIEAGDCAATLEVLDRAARALDSTLVVELRPGLVVGRSDQQDAVHAAVVAAVRRWLERRGFTCIVEVPIVDGRIRGWIDLLACDPVSGRLVVVEVKTELRDLGGLQRQVGWYVRAAPGAVAAVGWRPTRVVAMVVFLATVENDARLDAQRDAICSTFPLRGRALFGALAGEMHDGWGIAMVDPRRRGSRLWMGLRLDGRRTPAPYASYADFLSVARRGSTGAPRPPATRP
jgi:transcriptional regulator with XRE-family HTH domain